MRARLHIRAALAAAAIFAAITCNPAKAASPVTLGGNGQAHVALAAGGFDIINGHKPAGLFGGEFHFSQELFYIHPLLGMEVTTDGALYGYGGLGIDINLGPHWVLTPNAAVGGYDRGSGLRLGSTLEFRTGAELDYRFDDDTRLGLTFHHMSNAGIARHNPGEEEMTVTYAVPFGSLFKQ